MGEIADALRRVSAEPTASGPVGAAPSGIAHDRSPELPARASDEEIALIPTAKSGDWAARAVLVDPAHAIAVSYRNFAIRVRSTLEASSVRSVLVTSPLPREGKTTTACNLALALASMAAERRVAIVDLDLHSPAIARGLGLRPKVGLERALDGEAPLRAVRICTQFPGLDVFPALTPHSQAHQLLSSSRFKRLIATLTRSYDAVVVDSPPALILPDVTLIAPHIDTCVVVVRAGNTPRSAFREILDSVPSERLIGCFLNEAPSSRHSRYYNYYYKSDAGNEPGSGAAD